MSTKVTQGTTPTACICCNVPCLSSGFSCETRGGVATLCGHSEFGTASTPPRKYLNLSASGTNVSNVFSDSLCASPTSPTTITCVHSGTVNYNATTCVSTTTGGFTCSNGGTGGVTTNIAPSDCFKTVTQTHTTQTGVATNTCCPDGPIFSKQTAYGLAITLSNEDTEAAAIARMLAGTSWAACAGSPCCLAEHEQRTTGFSVHYQEARWSIVDSGLIPEQTYKAFVNYYRRPYGIGTYTLFQTDELTAVADISGDIEFHGDVPNAIGFQTYAEQGVCPP